MPRELTGSAVLTKLGKRVAPLSVKQHLAAREAEREQCEQARRDEQTARLAEQRAKLAAGEAVRCECCLRMIESAEKQPRKTEPSSTSETASRNGAAPTTNRTTRTTARRRSTRQRDQHRPPYLLTSIAGETQMHYSTHKWVEVLEWRSC